MNNNNSNNSNNSNNNTQNSNNNSRAFDTAEYNNILENVYNDLQEGSIIERDTESIGGDMANTSIVNEVFNNNIHDNDNACINICNDEKQSRWRSKIVWASIVSYILIILAITEVLPFSVDSPEFKILMVALGSPTIALGIINNPADKKNI